MIKWRHDKIHWGYIQIADKVHSPDFHVIRQEPPVDGLGGVCHEHPAVEAGLLQEVRQRAGVVQMKTEVGDKDKERKLKCEAR